MDILLPGLLVIFVLMLGVFVVIPLVLQLRKSTNASVDVSTPLQNLTQTIQEVRVQTAALIADSKARADIERQTADSIRRLEMTVAGSSPKGAAGERVVEELIAKLPIEWQVHNFRVGNKPVEFALRLPNNLILPIDSKWVASNLLEQFSNSTNPDEQKKLREQIEGVVIDKAKEVKKYLDPNITLPFGVAVVPDAVYSLCPSVNIETYKQHNVVVVSYSMFLPYLLLIFHTVLTTSQKVDTEKLHAHLQAVEQTIAAIEAELENRYSKALIMLDNSRRDLRAYISKAQNALTNLQVNSVQSETPKPDITNGK